MADSLDCVCEFCAPVSTDCRTPTKSAARMGSCVSVGAGAESDVRVVVGCINWAFAKFPLLNPGVQPSLPPSVGDGNSAEFAESILANIALKLLIPADIVIT